MTQSFTIRPIQLTDRAAWQPLWDDYNAFYGRHGASALAAEISAQTWQRFFDPTESMHALVAEDAEHTLVGMTHFLYHRSTTRIELTCYLNDLFTLAEARGKGVARALIAGVHQQAQAAGIKRVYWHTHESNAAGRLLYDKVAKNAGFIVYEHLP